MFLNTYGRGRASGVEIQLQVAHVLRFEDGSASRTSPTSIATRRSARPGCASDELDLRAARPRAARCTRAGIRPRRSATAPRRSALPSRRRPVLAALPRLAATPEPGRRSALSPPRARLSVTQVHIVASAFGNPSGAAPRGGETLRRRVVRGREPSVREPPRRAAARLGAPASDPERDPRPSGAEAARGACPVRRALDRASPLPRSASTSHRTGCPPRRSRASRSPAPTPATSRPSVSTSSATSVFASGTGPRRTARAIVVARGHVARSVGHGRERRRTVEPRRREKEVVVGGHRREAALSRCVHGGLQTAERLPLVPELHQG